MSKQTGDLVQIGLGVESAAARGTHVKPTWGMRWGDLQIDDKAVGSLDESRSGVEEDSRDLKVVGTYAEGKLTAPLRSDSIGAILFSLFGTVTPGAVAGETVVYDHTFAMTQNVNHPSLTLHRKDTNGGYDFSLAMISSFELSVMTDKHAQFAAGFRSKKGSQTLGTFTVTIANPGIATLSGHGLRTGDAVVPTTTGALPTGLTAGTTYYVIYLNTTTFKFATTLALALAGTAIETTGAQSGTHTLTLANRYVTYDNTEAVFLPQHATFKTAAVIADLAAAAAVKIRSAKIKIEQDVEDHRVLGSTAQEDIINKGLTITAEIVIARDVNTYVTALLAGTAYALRFDLSNTDVPLGTGVVYPRLRIDLNRAILESTDTVVAKGELALQTLVFKATYYETDTSMASIVLRNLVADYNVA